MLNQNVVLNFDFHRFVIVASVVTCKSYWRFLNSRKKAFLNIFWRVETQAWLMIRTHIQKNWPEKSFNVLVSDFSHQVISLWQTVTKSYTDLCAIRLGRNIHIWRQTIFGLLCPTYLPISSGGFSLYTILSSFSLIF